MAIPENPLPAVPLPAVPLPAVFDRAQHRRHLARRAEPADFTVKIMHDMAIEQIGVIARSFSSALVISPQAPPPLAAGQVHRGEMVAPLACDLETADFGTAQHDLIVSIAGLNWVNDVPGALIRMRRALVPDGFFLGVFVGGETLRELRHCLLQAEADVRGGAANRVSPMIDVRDAGGLLQRAGFAMPVADVDRLVVRYAHPLALLAEVRALGAAAAFADRAGTPPLRRDILARFCEHYAAQHSDPDGRVRATLDIISISGWAPAAGQPQARPRGSAKVSLASVLGQPGDD